MEFQKTAWENLEHQTKLYLQEIGHLNDGFWDDGVFEAQPYTIRCGGEAAGFLAVGQWAGEPMLRAFAMEGRFRGRGKEIFARACEEFQLKRLLASSNDGFFTALAFERMREAGGKFDVQAYNMTFGVPARKPEFGKECFYPVKEEEFPTVHAATEGQWEEMDKAPGFLMYRVEKDGKTLGYGAVALRRLDRECVDVGNYVLPGARRQGVGRSILIQLAFAALARGLRPTAGCAYANEASYRTLVSAGFLHNARLFKINLD